MAQFAPFRDVLARDQRFAELVLPIDLPSQKSAQRIVLVDIDANERAAAGAQPGARTPRKLIAELVHILRDAGAAGVFIDIDLRDESSEDVELMSELRRSTDVPVMLIHVIRMMPGCNHIGTENDTTASTDAPVEYPTPFDSATESSNVLIVHGILVKTSLGIVRGTCRTIRLRGERSGAYREIPAAALQSARLMNIDARGELQSAAVEPQAIEVSRWPLDAETTVFPGKADYPDLFRKINARWLRPIAKTDLSYLRGALVIIGTSGDEDLYPTPIGLLPGAVIHANIMMGQFLPATAPVSNLLLFLIDAGIALFVSCLAAGVIVWWPEWRRHRRFHRNRDAINMISSKSLIAKLIGSVTECILAMIIPVAIFYIVVRWFNSALATGWTFTLLASGLGALLLLAHSLLQLIEEPCRHAGERIARTITASVRGRRLKLGRGPKR